jgi:hypothetical protein
MTTLEFDSFWVWLSQHPNCLVRVETPDAVLYDDADLHWFIGTDGSELVVQAIRGKRLVGEIFVEPDRVSYVQDTGEQHEGEHQFELVTETKKDRFVAYAFVLTHGMESESESGGETTHGPAIH